MINPGMAGTIKAGKPSACAVAPTTYVKVSRQLGQRMHGIVTRRKIAGLSQNELAQKAGISQATISDIEAGNTNAPRVDTLQAIARVLGCTIDDLFGNEKSAG